MEKEEEEEREEEAGEAVRVLEGPCLGARVQLWNSADHLAVGHP